jgi:hypothetical protein
LRAGQVEEGEEGCEEEEDGVALFRGRHFWFA